MKKRSLLKMFLLEIVTFGIYRLYFLIKTRREMMDFNPNIKIRSAAFIFVPFILVFVAVILFIASIGYSVAHNSSTNCTKSSITTNNTTEINGTSTTDCPSGSLAPLLGILGFYAALGIAAIFFVVWEWSYAHGVATITDGKTSFALSIIILLIVPDGLDILIIQDAFNGVGETPPQIPQITPVPPTSPAPPMPPAPTVMPQ